MKIVFFGGSGFLGSHVCDKLSDAGHDVTIVDLRPSPYLRPDQKMVTGSLLDEDLVNTVVSGADAVFDFAIIHHVPDWQAAVAEIRRVLKPGGRFYFEEVTRHALDKWSYRFFMEHPTENRFTAAEFIREVERQGMIVGSDYTERGGGDFVFGVGRVAPAAG